ncbi:MAG: methyltransferase [Thermoleophilia bacterium]|nr:methyltransferase [Thermoleophilia bacterium]
MPIVRLPGVFRPVSDAQLLIDAIGREPLPPDATAVDLCTGTGVVAVAAARRGARVTAVDVSRRALFCARANGVLAGVRIDTARGDLFAPVDRRVHLITANPPYLPAPGPDEPTPRGAARAWEGGRDGREIIDRICADAWRHLRPGGAVLMVHSAIVGVRRTMAALQAGGLEPTVVARHRGEMGPLVRERAAALRARGFLHPEQVEEEVVVVRGLAPPVKTTPGAGARWAGIAGD